MAFYPWIDTLQVGQNCQSAETFGGDSERANGFAAGDVASSIRVNTALRQANLIACALMSAIGDTTHSVESTVSDIAQLIRDHIALDIPYYLVSQNFSIYTPLEMDSVDSRGCFSVCNNDGAKNKISNGHSNCYFFGEGLESYGSNQFLIGTYNGVSSSNDMLIVGSGSPTEGKNALRLSSNGGLWIGGNLALGGLYGAESVLRSDDVSYVQTLRSSTKLSFEAEESILIDPGVYSFDITIMGSEFVETTSLRMNVIFDTGDYSTSTSVYRFSQPMFAFGVQNDSYYCLRSKQDTTSGKMKIDVVKMTSGMDTNSATIVNRKVDCRCISINHL